MVVLPSPTATFLSWSLADLLKRLGLYSQQVDLAKEDILLARAATDPVSGSMVVWQTKGTIDKTSDKLHITSNYWRHIPGLPSRLVTPFRAVYVPTYHAGQFLWAPEEVWVQAKRIFPAPDMAYTAQSILRVQDMQAQINTHLRDRGAVEDVLKIITEAGFQNFLGEDFILKGLRKEGGFHPTAIAAQLGAAKTHTEYPIFEQLQPASILSLFGLDVNTIDPGKDYLGNRSVPALSHGTEREHEAKAEYKVTTDGELTFKLSTVPLSGDLTPVDVASITLRHVKDDDYQIEAPTYMGQRLMPKDWKDIMRVFGVIQSAGDDLAKYKYPNFLSHIGEYDLVQLMSPLGAAPSLKMSGGEFLTGSLHGTSFEKLADDFGNQIGICQTYLHRGTKPNGETSMVGVLVDHAIGIGGKNATFDRYSANIDVVLPYTKLFLITHGHFDHAAGYVDDIELGLMKGRVIAGSQDLIHEIRRQTGERQIPRSLWPQFVGLKGTGYTEIFDEDGVLRFCVQHCEGGTLHTAKTTPYIISAWYGHEHFKGSALIYGDGFGFSEQGLEFVKSGLKPLIAAGYPEEHCNRPITLASHDCTAVSEPGLTPSQDDALETLGAIFGWFQDKGILASPVSTNILDIQNLISSACASHRNVTTVGANMEKRLSNMNNFGVEVQHGEITQSSFVEKYIAQKVGELENGADIRFLRRETEDGKALREDPESLLIIATGAFGGRDEHQSTMQKFLQGTSLLDADMSVRPTGYKIDAQDYVYINLQTPSVPEKSDDQVFQNQITAYNRNIPVVSAFTRGFDLQNLEPCRYDAIMQDLQRRGWRYQTHSGNRRIIVYDRSMHCHGHPFEENLAAMARAINADFHEPIHIAGVDTHVAYIDLMRKLNLRTSGEPPRIFKLSSIDTYKPEAERFTPRIQLHEQLRLIRQHRRRDRGYGGNLEVQNVTIFRPDADNPIDGFMPRGHTNLATFFGRHATRPWAELYNPRNADGKFKLQKQGPAPSHQAPQTRRRRQGRPTLTTPLPPHIPRAA